MSDADMQALKRLVAGLPRAMQRELMKLGLERLKEVSTEFDAVEKFKPHELVQLQRGNDQLLTLTSGETGTEYGLSIWKDEPRDNRFRASVVIIAGEQLASGADWPVTLTKGRNGCVRVTSARR